MAADSPLGTLSFGHHVTNITAKAAARCRVLTSLTSKLKSARRPDIWSPCLETRGTRNPPPPPEVLGCYNYEEEKVTLPLALD